jgi:hypothetical protein
LHFTGRPTTPQNLNATDSEVVHVTFNYTKDIDGLTEIYFYESPKSAGIHEPGDDPHTMAVHNGWAQASEFSVDKQGFALRDFQTQFSDWDNDDAIRSTFYPEIVSFLKVRLVCLSVCD